MTITMQTRLGGLLGWLAGVLFMAPLIVNKGREKIVAYFNTGLATPFLGWGSSSTAESASQTDLVAANNESRAAAVQTVVALYTLQEVATITATGSRTVQEVGLFDGAGSGNPPSGVIQQNGGKEQATPLPVSVIPQATPLPVKQTE